MTEEPECARRIRVTGRVQGVGYRAWAAAEAAGLGLDGWVRNRIDGSVELVVRGAPDRVRALVDACRIGPAMAHVTEIAVEPTPGVVADGFVTKRTV